MRGAPAVVRDFIDRRANCIHWWGEYPFDAERKEEIDAALTDLRCSALESEEVSLRKRYTTDRHVLSVLDESRDLAR